MRKSCLLLLSIIAATNISSRLVTKVSEPAEWLNPLMGMDSKVSLSNENTYPAIAVPWRMNFWVQQRGAMGNGWQYQSRADKIT